MQRGVSISRAAGYPGVSAEIVDRVYGHYSSDHMSSAARAITGKTSGKVSVVVSVVGKD
jgi:hypothetical protein